MLMASGKKEKKFFFSSLKEVGVGEEKGRKIELQVTCRLEKGFNPHDDPMPRPLPHASGF